MVDAALAPDREDVGPASPKPRRHWLKRLGTELLALIGALLLLAGAALVFLDTAPGHRWIVDRIAALETASGLKIRIGRIDGSIFGKMTLRSVAVSDTRGVFLTSPEIRLDWAPGGWLYNSLHVDSVEAGKVTLGRLPVLRRTGRTGPILPDFDIHVGRLSIARLELLEGVTGTPRYGRVEGAATIRAGRAMVDLRGLLNGGGDRLTLRLDAEPDRDRFDLGVNLTAPADGLVPALLGLKRPIALRVAGDGRWSAWRGAAELDLSGQAAARLRLAADAGRYRLGGFLVPAPFTTGKLQRLTSPRVQVSGEGRLEDRVLDGRLALRSAALRAVASGGVDLANSEWRNVTLGADLLRPAALFPNMSGRNVRLVWTLNGPFDRADFAYRLTSPQVAFDDTGFVDVRAEGRGRVTPWPMRVPLRLTAQRITGVGDEAGAILANARLEGMLSLTPKALQGQGLQLTSDKLKARVSLMIDLASGRFDVLLSGGLTRYFIPGLGIVDVTSDLRVEPGPGGRGSRVVGTGTAQVRRLDNSFFRNLTGGLPRITTRLERLPDGVLRFEGLQLASPKLRLTGSGIRRRDGTFRIEAVGRQAEYGPVRMLLDGPIARPRVELLLARPNDTLRLSDVRVSLAPSAAGFDYRAAGGSWLGAFTSTGQILLPQGAPATVAIGALEASGIRAQGQLRADPGGFTGRLTLAGALAGDLLFEPQGQDQRIEARLSANGLRLTTPLNLAVRSGQVEGAILLADGSTALNGRIDARGVTYAGVALSRVAANARLVNGTGQVQATLAGQQGAAFSFTTQAQVAPERIVLTGRGSLGGRPLALTTPAVLTARGGGWDVAPTALTYAGGSATVSGRSGPNPMLNADLRRMPMSILDVLRPDLDLGGIASGRLSYAWGTGRPEGRADLTVRGLSRAGLVLASKPIDMGIAAVLRDGRAAMRAVAVSDGRTIGRAQARFAPLAGGSVIEALRSAPMFAQVRYAGPADTLWRLSGVEVLDLSGPVAIGADLGGRITDPVIRGSLRTSGARLESSVTGMVVTDVAAAGAFSGSRLVLTSLSGRTPGGGSISGNGTVDFAGGLAALDVRLNASEARLLARDDIAADVTGPLVIRSGGVGGTLSGDLRLNRGRFTLGRASAAASVPRLAVRHIGLAEDEVITTRELAPWRLDFRVRGSNLTVRGLGIDSIWTTDVEVGGRADAPSFTGTANLVRGNYEFAGRNFRLERGAIRFRDESPPDPLLDIVAQAEVQGLDASVLVRGTGLKPEITFASDPALPQEELLARLLFGTSIANLSAPEAIQLASAVAGLQSGDGSLDPINAVRRAAGLDRLRILPADVSTGQRTAISAGKYLGRRLYVEVITDGQGYSATRAEYQVTRWLSLLSSVSTIGRTSANVRVSRDY